jgi:hypothetical protein
MYETTLVHWAMMREFSTRVVEWGNAEYRRDRDVHEKILAIGLKEINISAGPPRMVPSGTYYPPNG